MVVTARYAGRVYQSDRGRAVVTPHRCKDMAQCKDDRHGRNQTEFFGRVWRMLLSWKMVIKIPTIISPATACPLYLHGQKSVGTVRHRQRFRRLTRQQRPTAQ